MKIELLETSVGKCPIKDFFKSIDESAQNRILQNLELISEFSLAHSKYSKLLEKMRSYNQYKLYEFKTKFNRMEYRILCCLYESTLYLVHGFIKKTQKIPMKEIHTAIQRIKSLILA